MEREKLMKEAAGRISLLTQDEVDALTIIMKYRIDPDRVTQEEADALCAVMTTWPADAQQTARSLLDE